MEARLKILLLEDSATDAEMIQRTLRKELKNCEFRLVSEKTGFLEALRTFEPHAIISDNSLPQYSGPEALAETRKEFPLLPFILVTGTVSEEFAVDIIKKGADDYILKDRMIRLPAALKTALHHRRSQKEKNMALQHMLESEEKYRTLVERVSEGFLSLNNDWIITYINKIAETMIGRTPGSLLGKHIWKEFPEVVGKPFYIAYHQAAKTQKYIRLEDFSIVSGKWMEVRIYPSPSGLSIYFHDNTEQKKAEDEARTSQEKYRILVQRISDAFVALDKNWCYTYLNEKAGELMQRNPQDLVGKNIWSEFPEAVGSVTYSSFLKAMREQVYVTCTDYYAPFDLWYENFIYPSPDGLSIFIRDISERKKAERHLLQTQKRFEQAQAIAHLGNWEVNFQTDRSTWSDEAYRIYGIEPGDHQFTYNDWLSFIHPDDRERVLEVLKVSQEAFTDISFHHRIILKDGTEKYIFSQAKYEFNSEGKPVGLYGIVHDETESKLAEEEVRQSNERFVLASKATLDIIWELNFDTRQFLVHEGGQKLFGKTETINWQTGIEGKYIVDEDRERIRASFGQARMDAGAELWKEEYKVLSKDGFVLHIINQAVFIRDKKGVALRAVGAITDVTEERRLQYLLAEQQRHEQLRITATALEAQEKERNAIGLELHDNVNQIIVGTKLMLSMARTVPQKTEEIIAAAMENLQDAINENRKIAHSLVAPDLKEKNLIEQLADLANTMFDTSGIQVHFDTSDYTDESLNNEQKLAIYRVAQEQCTNIVKYAKAHMVVFSLFTNRDLFKMTIEDDGVGVDMAKKQKGIGLRNINARLSVLDGYAIVESEAGKGFKLSIEIPLETGYAFENDV
jgi:PAS domain S-box-containing protein